MYQPAPLSAAPGAVAAVLADRAHERKLTIYAGAGISAAPPTRLPGARRLAELVFADLSSVVTFPATVTPTDLLSVADAVAAEPRGHDLLSRTLMKVVPLQGAPVNYGHQVLALLICEGAATVFETNYDDCIERAAQPELLPVVRTSGEMLHGPGAALLKGHGCVSLPPTMLVTTADLDGVGLWAEATVIAKLSQNYVAFMGIGSVADYVRVSITRVLETIGTDHITVVDPALADWDADDELEWKQLLPELRPEQRVNQDASEFADALLRAYLLPMRQNLKRLVAGFDPGQPQRVGLETVLSCFESSSSVQFLRWLRNASWGLRTGQTALSPTTTQVFVALGALAGDNSACTTHPVGFLSITPSAATPSPQAAPSDVRWILTLIVHGTDGGTVAAAEARRRITEARGTGILPEGGDVVVVVGGHIGSLGLEEVPVSRSDTLADVLRYSVDVLDGTIDNVVGDGSSDHLIDGPATGRVLFVSAALLGDTKAA